MMATVLLSIFLGVNITMPDVACGVDQDRKKEPREKLEAGFSLIQNGLTAQSMEEPCLK